ncbi:hypothetical protein B6U71_03810 [Euryarchaeota archaeon ex4484_178]|nr:MAG: hypothetical protein B6U71_03810 [Euryarchaeota archaeon ex4484_178]
MKSRTPDRKNIFFQEKIPVMACIYGSEDYPKSSQPNNYIPDRDTVLNAYRNITNPSRRLIYKVLAFSVMIAIIYPVLSVSLKKGFYENCS